MTNVDGLRRITSVGLDLFIRPNPTLCQSSMDTQQVWLVAMRARPLSPDTILDAARRRRLREERRLFPDVLRRRTKGRGGRAWEEVGE